jgi:hypothetical protein
LLYPGEGGLVLDVLWGTKHAKLITSGVALLVILALTVVGVRLDLVERIRHDAAAGPAGTVQGTRRSAEITVQPGAPASLTVGHVRLDIPAGVVTTPTVAHLALAGAGQSLIGQLPKQTAGFLKPKGEVIRVDLSGRQPLKPLTLTVPPYAGRQPVLLSKHAGEVVTALRLRRTPDGLVAKLTRLSDFLTAIVETAKAINSFAATLKPFIDEATGVQGDQPGCVGRELKLEDDSTVKTAELSQEDILWPCVELVDGRIRVTVHNVSAAPWRIRSESGSYDGAAQPKLADAAKQALVTALTTDKDHNDGYVLSQSSGRWTFDLGDLPSGMAGRVSLGMYLAEITAFAAIMIASLPAKGKDAYMAARTAALGIAELSRHPNSAAWSCLVEAGKVVADGVRPDARTYGALAKLALSCVGTFVRVITGASLSVLGRILITILTTGVALVAGAILGMTHTILDGEGIVSWRVLRNLSRQALFDLMVGSWTRHSTNLVIKPDGSGRLGWRTYTPCGTEEPGHACDSGPPPYLEGGGAVFIKLVVISGTLKAQVLKSNDSYFPVGATLPMRFEHGRQILVFGDDSNPRNVGYFRLCADPDRIPTDPSITSECGA